MVNKISLQLDVLGIWRISAAGKHGRAMHWSGSQQSAHYLAHDSCHEESLAS